MPHNTCDVLLIDPPWYRLFGQQKSARPIGLCYLAAVLEKNGIRTAVYNADMQRGARPVDAVSTTDNYAAYTARLTDRDAAIWQEVRQVINDCRPRVVGITILTAKYGAGLMVARIVKEIAPRVPVVAGGIHPSVLPEQTLAEPEIDFIVRGEGEYGFLELVQALLRGDTAFASIPGIAYQEGARTVLTPPRPGALALDDIPHPANDAIIHARAMLPDDFSRLFASRGCPYRCIFCASHAVWSHQVRYRSPENVVEEIALLERAYRPTYYQFEDDSFSLDQRYVRQVCELLRQRRVRVRWGCETRVDLVTDELLKTMRRAGCVKIQLGAESGSDGTLQKIKKNITVRQIRDAVSLCRKNRLEVAVFFVIGFPWEQEHDIRHTVSFMKELDPDFAVYSIATPYPGTELFDLALQEGLISRDLDWGAFFHQSPEMFLTRRIPRARVRHIIEDTERIFLRHNIAKQRQRLLHPDKLYWEIKEHCRSPRELLARVAYVLGENLPWRSSRRSG